MTQLMDAFLRSFIGYGQDQITNLDIRWEAYSDGLTTEARAGSLRSWSTKLLMEALGSSR
jgi:hypothetical protein